MAKSSDTGLKQLKNGNWAYRVTIIHNGKRKDSTFTGMNNENPFTRKIDAKRAREKKLLELRIPKPIETFTDCKLSEMWDCYLKSCTRKSTLHCTKIHFFMDTAY